MNNLRTALIIILAAFLLTACSDTSTYSRRQDGHSLYAVLYNQVSNGDSKEDIKTLIGSGSPLPQQTIERMMPQMKTLASKSPDQFPDGIRESDNFVSYKVDQQHHIILMFRDGVIVNHVKDKFKNFTPANERM